MVHKQGERVRFPVYPNQGRMLPTGLVKARIRQSRVSEGSSAKNVRHGNLLDSTAL